RVLRTCQETAVGKLAFGAPDLKLPPFEAQIDAVRILAFLRFTVAARIGATTIRECPNYTRSPPDYFSLTGSMSVGTLFSPSIARCISGRTTPHWSSIFLAAA